MKLAVAGAGGRMGQALIEAAAGDPELELVAALDAPKSPALGIQAGGLKVTADLGAIAAADALLDFTRPEGTLKHLKYARAIVIGTTGFTEEDKG
ncbi:MAG TPA: 4-hydroxy-tetrahydrodipicolinate reductase, partial [Burkholderiales bacterium]|nr:4-hydroxy-tetrahydrodipicolinate reductase [Burkholderiales bacterium]